MQHEQPPPRLMPAPTDGALPDQAPTPPRSYIAGILTAGLSAVCGAVLTSWFGVQGTLVGAMLGATIGSSVSEIVRTPLTSLERRIIQSGTSGHRLRRDGLVKTLLSSPAAARQALGMVSGRAIVTVATVAIVGFALAAFGLTAVEVAQGEPLAAILSDSEATGTTVGNIVPNPPPVLAPDPATAVPVQATGTPSQGEGAAGAPATNENVAASPEAERPAASGAGGEARPGASPSPDAAAGASAAGTPPAGATATALDATATAQSATATAQAATATAQIATATVQASDDAPSVAATAIRATTSPGGTPPPAATAATTPRPSTATTPAASSGGSPSTATPTPTATATPTRTPTGTPTPAP
jgi:hypothetical protein